MTDEQIEAIYASACGVSQKAGLRAVFEAGRADVVVAPAPAVAAPKKKKPTRKPASKK